VTLSLNEPYWQYAAPMIESARKFLLPGHEVDFILFSDMPTDTKIDARIIPTEAHQWPLPTLMRYSVMLREEKLLSEYDYVYFCDCDMRFVGRVGDEILGDLVAAQHPMYALRRNYHPPYEPNRDSAAYIPRVGRIVMENGQKRLEPLYLAGGFQGGRSDIWISAMKEMDAMISKDFVENGYVPIWNDESVFNRYCLDHPPTVVLSPSYIYPDSLINEYYRPLWGRNYCPRLVTITKQFSLSKEGGSAVKQMTS
jgi:histo-blood group ABO system transferase